MPKRNRNLSERSTEYERDAAEAIGARARTRRKELQLTQEEVRKRMAALQVEVIRTQFSRIELGDSLLSAAEVRALAAALGVSYEWLLDGKLAAQTDEAF